MAQHEGLARVEQQIPQRPRAFARSTPGPRIGRPIAADRPREFTADEKQLGLPLALSLGGPQRAETRQAQPQRGYREEHQQVGGAGLALPARHSSPKAWPSRARPCALLRMSQTPLSRVSGGASSVQLSRRPVSGSRGSARR